MARKVTSKGSAKAFRDRADAGRRLGAELAWLKGQDVVVLAVPRGGVPVAVEVAAALQAPVDVLAVRRVDLPGKDSLPIGAVGEGGVDVVLDEVVRLAGAPRLVVAQAQRHAREELEAAVSAYREVAPDLPLAGRVAVIVDDGAVTGATVRVACRVARARGAERVVVALPVAAPEVLAVLAEERADVVRALFSSREVLELSTWYDELPELTDDRVRAALSAATGLSLAVVDLTGSAGPGPVLTPVPQARGLVVLAGPGSAATATALRGRGWATLLLGTLAEGLYDAVDELVAATREALGRPEFAELPTAWMGSGAAVQVMLEAAAELGAPVQAVVGRGGRPDLARAVLPNVAAPTLLLAAARDRRSQEHARAALSWMRCASDLKVVPGASEGFDDPVAEPEAALLATDHALRWLDTHLAHGRAPHHV